MSTATDPLAHGPQAASAGAHAAADPDGPTTLPRWLRRGVESWGVRRSSDSWVGGVLGGVADRWSLDPLLVRGCFVALCALSAGLGMLAYAAAWAVLPDAEGRVHLGRLRRREWTDATVAIAAVGVVGALNMVLGAGLTILAPAVGGVSAFLGLAAAAALAWWLVTRWDGPRERRAAHGAADTGRGDVVRGTAEPDATGFRADWIDPDTGLWRDRVHPREARAAARLAQEDARTTVPGTRTATGAERRRVVRALRPVLHPVLQLGVHGAASVAGLTAWVLTDLAEPGATLTVTVIPGLLVALAVVAAGMVFALVRGRRPGSLAPASGVLVGAVAVQTAVLLAVT